MGTSYNQCRYCSHTGRHGVNAHTCIIRAAHSHGPLQSSWREVIGLYWQERHCQPMMSSIHSRTPKVPPCWGSPPLLFQATPARFQPPKFQLTPPPKRKRVGLFYLRLGLFCLWLVFVAYSNLVWSFLLTVENRFGLFCLRFPPSGNWFGLFCLRFPPCPEIGFGLFTYGSPTVSKKDEP